MPDTEFTGCAKVATSLELAEAAEAAELVEWIGLVAMVGLIGVAQPVRNAKGNAVDNHRSGNALKPKLIPGRPKRPFLSIFIGDRCCLVEG